MGYLIRQTVDLLDPKTVEMSVGGIAYKGDSAAHTWEVTVRNAAGWLTATGVTAGAEFRYPDGTTYTQSATIYGSTVRVIFGSTPYSKTGAVRVCLKLTDTGAASGTASTTTIAALNYSVIE